MAGVQGLLLAAVLLLATSSASSLPACPKSCTCLSTTLNCTYSALSSVPHHIHNNVSNLDLSHNRLHSVSLRQTQRDLQAVWLANNSITHLSLCMERVYKDTRGRRIHHLRRGCVSWAPALQLLSAERNQLVQLPQGLNSSKSLQVLQLSFNKISTLPPEEFQNLRLLEELYLQHNLVTSLHPLMFQDLVQLRVLDVSFNLLNRLHPSAYLSLRNIGAHVRLHGNRWECDCGMRTLRRWIVRDHSRGLQPWSVVCASPPMLSGTDLLQLEDDDLDCFSSEGKQQRHQEVTVHSGSRIVLSCSLKDSPSDLASENQSLLMSDVAEEDTVYVYVCVSEDPDVPSDFNMQIRKTERQTKRKTRSVGSPVIAASRMVQERNASATPCNLALAVCLSILITFLVAFILGVIARPYVAALWERFTRKRSATETHSDSHMEQGQYDNEAFSEEEAESRGTHRERRVTFSSIDNMDVRNVDYYNIEEAGGRETYIEVLNKTENNHKSDDSDSVSSVDQRNPRANELGGQKSKLSAHPHELDVRRSLSSSSNSSTSDVDVRKIHVVQTTARSPELAVELVQQKADWSQTANQRSQELSPDNGEQFKFSDSSQSSSARSSGRFGPFEGHKQTVNKSNAQLRHSGSSSSSQLSADEVFVTHGHGLQTKWKSPSSAVKDSPRVAFSSSSSSDDERTRSVKHRLNKHISSEAPQSTDSDDEIKPPGPFKLRPIKRRFAVKHAAPETLNKSEQRNSYLDVSSPTDSSSSSDTTRQKPRTDKAIFRGKSEAHVYQNEPTQWPSLDLKHVSRLKRRLAFKVMSPVSDSSSSSDSEEETAGVGVQLQEYESVHWRPLEHVKPIKATRPKRSLTSDSSTSSDSEDERKQQHVVQLELKTSQPVNHDEWPSLNFHNMPQLKRRLEFKVRLQVSDSSSSSDSEEETVGIGHQVHEYETIQETIRTQQQDQWTVITQRETHLQTSSRDSKSIPPATDSSSSSDSEDEAIVSKQHQEKYVVKSELKTSQPVNHDEWPSLNFHNIPQLKRRLEFKVHLQVSDSSSSSDSEEETVGVGVRPTLTLERVRIKPIKRRFAVKTTRQNQSLTSDSSTSSDSEDERKQQHVVKSEVKTSQPVNHDEWPSLNFHNIPQLKRRLEFKVRLQVSDSSSSSDSEEETVGIGHQVHEYETIEETIRTQQQDQWTVITQRETQLRDSTPIPHVNKHFETPSRVSDSSSSSDSEDETIVLKPKHQEKYVVQSELKTSQPVNHDEWPSLNFHNIPQLKRRLEFKVQLKVSDSSSSSDSEEDTVGVRPTLTLERVRIRPIKRRFAVKTTRQNSSLTSDSSTSSDSEDERKQQHVVKSEVKTSQPVNHDEWPSLNFHNIPQLKRRLEFKVQSQVSDSSSSSDSDEETVGIGHQVHEYETIQETIRTQQQDQWTVVTQRETQLRDSTPIPHVNKHFETPSRVSDSSSSSDSEYETIVLKPKHQEKYILQQEVKTSQPVNHDEWPSLNFHNIPQVKRRLEFKVSLQVSDSSSSSDSEEETVGVGVQPTLTLERVRIRPIKRRFAVKTTRQNSSLTSDSSTSSDSEDERKQQHVVKSEVKTSQPVNHDEWPSLNFHNIPQLKRRLEFKVQLQVSDSSSSSDSEEEGVRVGNQIHEYETVRETVQIQPQDQWTVITQRETHLQTSSRDSKSIPPATDSSSSSDSEDDVIRPKSIVKPEAKTSPTMSHTQTRWPSLELQRIPKVKRRLQFKVTVPVLYSSSSSDSEGEAIGTQIHVEETIHIKRDVDTQKENRLQMPGTYFHRVPYPKRRLDIRTPSPAVDSSSSSESEDDRTSQQSKTEFKYSTNSAVELSTSIHDNRTRTPSPGLPLIPKVKRRMNFKVQLPSSDSSSSSDSENEWVNVSYIEVVEEKLSRLKTREKTLSRNYVTKSPPEKPQEKTLEEGLKYSVRIKRRLDIKAIPVDSNSSSSSSESDDEVRQAAKEVTYGERISHDMKTLWPNLDFGHTLRIKRRLDFKTRSSSSSSSDSEDETKDPEKPWPIIDLNNTRRLRRRMDIKGPVPEPPAKIVEEQIQIQNEERVRPHLERATLVKTASLTSDSSSSSDSEVETVILSQKSEQEVTKTPEFKVQASQNVSHEHQEQWPGLDFSHIPQVKRRLDFKTQTRASDSSSSSDSEDETAPEKWWPIVDLQNRKRLRRCLDIKPVPLLYKDSSAGIVEAQIIQIQHKEPREGSLKGFHQEPQVEQFKPYPKFSIKRRLDIKAPTPVSDSSSSSDSEVEPTVQAKITVQEATYRPGFPVVPPRNARPQLEKQGSRLDLVQIPPEHPSDSSSSSDSDDETTKTDPEKWWPIVDLQHRKRLRRRLDFKPVPLLYKESKNTVIVEKQTIEMQNKEPEMGTLKGFHQEPQVEQFKAYPKFSIKRRLDIKAPTPVSDSSSSSDSEVEPTVQSKITVQEATYRPGFPVVPPRNARPQLEKQGTRVDLVQIPSEHPSDSSSSSDSDDETTKTDPEKWWPIVDLQHRKRLRRRLDFKPVPLLYNESKNTVIVEKQTIEMQNKEPEMGSLKGFHQEPQVEQFKPYPKFSIKRRLDIKAPTPVSDSSSSSDSEVEPTVQAKITVQEATYRPTYPVVPPRNARPQLKKQETRVDSVEIPSEHPSDSSSSSDSDEERMKTDPEKWWPIVDLQHRKRLRRRLDFKPVPPLYKESESTVMVEKRTIEMQNKEPEMGSLKGFHQEPQVEQFKAYPKFSIKRRLDIKAPTPVSDSSSSSDSEVEPTVQAKITVQEATYRPKYPVVPPRNARPQLEKQGSRLDLVQIPPEHPSDSSSSSDSDGETTKMDPEKWWPIVDLQHRKRLRRRLDIKASTPLFETSTDRAVQTKPQVQYQPNTSQDFYEVRQTSRILRPKPSIERPKTTSSSSSDSETETIPKHQNTDPKSIYRVHSWNKTSPNLSRDSKQDPEKWWPIVDLQHRKRLRRRLDIKPKSSTGVELSENTMMLRQRKEPAVVTTMRPPEMPKSLPKSDSSSSDSEAEANIPSQEATYRTQSVARTSQKTIYDPKPNLQRLNMDSLDSYRSVKIDTWHKNADGTQENWPLVDLEHRKRPNQRLDFKAAPSKLPSMGESLSNSREMTDLELQSRWASMNLGSSRSRQRHGSASRSTTPISSPLSESPYTSGNEGTMRSSSRTQLRRTGLGKETSLRSANTETGVFTTVASEVRDYTGPTSEQILTQYSQLGVDTKTSTLQAHHGLHSSSSSSESEDEEHKARPNTRTGTEEAIVEYKRTIIKTASKPSDSGRYTRPNTLEDAKLSQSGDRSTFRARMTDPVISFESKKYSAAEELPTEWRSRRVDFSSSTTPTEPANFSPYSSKSLSHKSDDDLMQDQVIRSSTPEDKYSSMYNNGGPALADDAFDMLYMPRTERRGLGALKAMSTERTIWDSRTGDLLGDFLDGSDQQSGRQLISEVHYPSSVFEKRGEDLLDYQVVFDEGIPSGLPPPLPTTPLPE